jgi:hypothetical protein
MGNKRHPFKGFISLCRRWRRRVAMALLALFALALLGMPIQVLAPSVISAILAGGAAACAAAGVPVAGGHSIDSVEPIYGLAVTGMVELSHLRRNAAAQVGDQLILAKPVGVGVLSAAFKKGALDADGYATLLAMTTQLNAVGHRLAGLPGLHAMTDVTGFGLLGHLSEMARGADLHMAVSVAEAPVLPLARALRLPLDDRSLTRVRDTPPQSLLPWRARKKNVRHAFACTKDFSGQSVIVVDDVMTTGATLDAVARLLKDHGATQVTNWVAARAVRDDAI